MKSITLIAIYLMSFMFFFFLLSCIGMLWVSYTEVISDGAWFFFYSILIGWWIAIAPTQEYYEHNRDYFERIFD